MAGAMRIGELAERAGATTRAIRYYEQVGLLCPDARSESGYRLIVMKRPIACGSSAVRRA